MTGMTEGIRVAEAIAEGLGLVVSKALGDGVGGKIVE